jgi:plasmid maintenance system killer protein
LITSFENELTEDVYQGIHSHAVRKKLKGYLVKAAERKLDLLNCAESLDGLRLIPSHKPDNSPVRDGQEKYSIPIEEELRLAFRWNDGHATHVEIK